MRNPDPAFGEADTTNCDREPIHIPGSIQPHGALLALEPLDLRVLQAGGDTRRLLGAEPAALLGRAITNLLAPAQSERLKQLILSGGAMTRPLHAFQITVDGEQRAVDASIHESDGLIILELEPLLALRTDDALVLVQSMVRKVQAAEGLSACCQAITDEVRAVLGFDRVMVYRFLADGCGVVAAESRRADMEPFLGLRYPASDIPQQARALYKRNWIRVIPDARYVAAPLQPPLNPKTARPLDLSQSALRSVSPIHLEYLANMGVRASTSLSIILRGQLWGLIACHHDSPRHVPHHLRVAFELFSQMTSFLLETKVAAEEFAARNRTTALHDGIMNALAREGDLASGLTTNRPSLLDYIPAIGVGVWMDGHFAQLGSTPAPAEISGLVAWLSDNVTDGVYHTDHLAAAYPAAESFAGVASGILALAVSRMPRDYVIWFRPEVVRTVTWAGDPDKSAAAPLSPRKSFAAWQQQMRFRSEPWANIDVQTAEALRVSLMEVVLQRIDQTARDREQARLRQEELLRELDLRIKQWEATAAELKTEGDRRAVVEEELSQVLRRTVVDQENERQRIARELHDSLGQYLTVMKFDLDDIARSSGASAEVQKGVAKLKELTSEVGQEINRLAWEIRPTSLDDLGLQTAVQQFIEEWVERSGLQIDVHLTLSHRRLPPDIETTLYRILQEAVMNAVKHSDAAKLGIILEATASEVHMIVEDDGKGFLWEDEETAKTPSARLGLLGVRERLTLIGGRLEIESSPGRGTTLIVHVPL